MNIVEHKYYTRGTNSSYISCMYTSLRIFCAVYYIRTKYSFILLQTLFFHIRSCSKTNSSREICNWCVKNLVGSNQYYSHGTHLPVSFTELKSDVDKTSIQTQHTTVTTTISILMRGFTHTGNLSRSFSPTEFVFHAPEYTYC